MAKTECGGSSRLYFIGMIIKFITQDDPPFRKSLIFREGVEHFGFGTISGAVTDLIAIGNRD